MKNCGVIKWFIIIVGLLFIASQNLFGSSDDVWKAATVRPARTPVDVAEGRHGMVVSVTAESSRVGREILEKGGNAVDASVAIAFALAVTWPEAGNIGGGGFMMISPKGGDVVCVEYREKAPMAATRDMFADTKNRWNGLAVGVPGTVRGLEKAHQAYGRLPWRELVMPAVVLANDGFIVDEHLAFSINSVLSKKTVRTKEIYAELRRIFAKRDGSPWVAGDRLVQKDLARSLSLIANNGADGFYHGELADKLVAQMKRGNGIISHEDLARYQAKIRPAVTGTYRGYHVFGPALPSSGGTVLVEALNILENFNLSKHSRYSPESIHLVAEAMRYGFSDRAKHLGDSDFVTIPSHLTTKSYAKNIASKINLVRATKSEQIATPIVLAPESPSTTHFSVVDQDGMAVSNTYTLESSWGSRVVVEGAGFLLNNEMGDFNWTPDYTNRKGKIGTAANQIVPEKRMLSSQTPVIVKKNNKVVLVAGSPGGRTIINTVMNILINTIDYKIDLPDAIDLPRIHHQWFPDVLQFEGYDEPQYAKTIVKLEAYGHAVDKRKSPQGSAHCISVQVDGQLIGVADWRRGGKAEAAAKANVQSKQE
ncbi:gamma-glutamyltransferase [Poriferisphaera sp. WC338]|uniref:gamma-glutamyltransferase n=1 Tax=Poriferisphaera sp. WC338 TaxID=3425129 RepID=UPI003D81A015